MKFFLKAFCSMLYVVVLLFTLSSCDSILDHYQNEKDRERYTSPFMGKWNGTYIGDESGTFSITVAKSGSISGTYGPYNDPVYSSVGDDGVLAAISSNDPKFFYLHGNLVTKKGNWRKSNLKGDWIITKQ